MPAGRAWWNPTNRTCGRGDHRTSSLTSIPSSDISSVRVCGVNVGFLNPGWYEHLRWEQIPLVPEKRTWSLSSKGDESRIKALVIQPGA